MSATLTQLTQERSVTVRRAEPGDGATVRELFGTLYAHNAALEPRLALADGWEGVLAEQLAGAQAAGSGVALLAWDGDEPVGLLMLAGHVDSPLLRHGRWAQVVALYVAPKARGAGVADRLLEAGLAWARAQGYPELRVAAAAANERAQRFYARAGLRPIQQVLTVALDPALAAADGADAPAAAA